MKSDATCQIRLNDLCVGDDADCHYHCCSNLLLSIQLTVPSELTPIYYSLIVPNESFKICAKYLNQGAQCTANCLLADSLNG